MIGTVVIKAVRACNLRCPYCYYINDQTVGYGKVVSAETLARLYSSTAEYLTDPDQVFTYVWHGGEPLILGRGRFQEFLDAQCGFLDPGRVRNVVQTNGVLIDQDWIDFFQRNDVGVGISIDGTREAHDKNRVTPGGAGTYDTVVDAVRLFAENGMPVGTLSVIDGDFSGYAAVEHIQQLGVPACDFLIPMTNNALQDQAAAGNYHSYTDFAKIGSFLEGAFRRWVEQSEPDLTIRLFECLIRNAFGFESGYLDAGATNLADFLVLETDGELCLDPDFWHIDRYGLGSHYRLAANVHDDDFSMVAVERQMAEFIRTYRLDSLPDECQTCTVRSICRGSHPASRFGSDGSFNHRSAYCRAMFAVCEKVLEFIVERGYAEHLCDEDLQRYLGQRDTLSSR
jgi:uncharacterized protein